MNLLYMPLVIIVLLIAVAALWLIEGPVRKLSWADVKTIYTED
jgi:hypothetical protein